MDFWQTPRRYNAVFTIPERAVVIKLTASKMGLSQTSKSLFSSAFAFIDSEKGDKPS